MIYFLLHFDGTAVTGFISPLNDKDEAFISIKRSLIRSIHLLKLKLEQEPYHSTFIEQDIRRQKSFLKCFKQPWRKTKDGTPVLEVQELSLPVHVTYWAQEIVTNEYTCNILPKQSFLQEQ